MYSVADYGAMVADVPRMRAYESALREVVRPGDVVVDLGAGTGILSLLACKLGARKVYAIDPNPAIALARACADANGYGDRVVCFAATAAEVVLPERADVLMGDVRGAPLRDDHVPAFLAARDRFLKPGGKTLPVRDEWLVAAIECEQTYERLRGSFAFEGLDLSPARDALFRAPHALTREELEPFRRLGEPAVWASLDYRAERAAGMRGSANLVVETGGVAHGLATWFRAHLTGEVTLETGPARPGVYATGFLPFDAPVALRPGDRLRVHIAAAGSPLVWGWTTEIEGSVRRTMRQCEVPLPAALLGARPR